MIRVIVADDHAIVRTGLERLLATADDVELVGMAEDGNAAVRLTEELSPDVVIMDLSMPELDGIAATRQIIEGTTATRVIVLTSFSDNARINDALEAGATG